MRDSKWLVRVCPWGASRGSAGSVVCLVVVIVKTSGLNGGSQIGQLCHTIVEAFDAARQGSARRQIQRPQTRAVTQNLADWGERDGRSAQIQCPVQFHVKHVSNLQFKRNEWQCAYLRGESDSSESAKTAWSRASVTAVHDKSTSIRLWRHLRITNSNPSADVRVAVQPITKKKEQTKIQVRALGPHVSEKTPQRYRRK